MLCNVYTAFIRLRLISPTNASPHNLSMGIKTNEVFEMIKKLLPAIVMLSSLYIPNAVSGDLSDAASMLGSVASMQGNVGIGVNASNATATINSTASGANANANAGLAVIDASGSGKSVNAAIGYNSGTAEITADAQSGGNANAGLTVIKSH